MALRGPTRGGERDEMQTFLREGGGISDFKRRGNEEGAVSRAFKSPSGQRDDCTLSRPHTCHFEEPKDRFKQNS